MAFFVVLIIIIVFAVWVVGLYNGLVTSRNGFKNAFVLAPNYQAGKAWQAKLAENGLYNGPIDGDFGPTTRRSIRAAFGILEAEN